MATLCDQNTTGNHVQYIKWDFSNVESSLPLCLYCLYPPLSSVFFLKTHGRKWPCIHRPGCPVRTESAQNPVSNTLKRWAAFHLKHLSACLFFFPFLSNWDSRIPVVYVLVLWIFDRMLSNNQLKTVPSEALKDLHSLQSL